MCKKHVHQNLVLHFVLKGSCCLIIWVCFNISHIALSILLICLCISFLEMQNFHMFTSGLKFRQMFPFIIVKFLCLEFKFNVPTEITSRGSYLSGHSITFMFLHSNSKMNPNGSSNYAHNAHWEHKSSY
jgi:hypothetical protein